MFRRDANSLQLKVKQNHQDGCLCIADTQTLIKKFSLQGQIGSWYFTRFSRGTR
jgi:hypothetical protein